MHRDKTQGIEEMIRVKSYQPSNIKKMDSNSLLQSSSSRGHCQTFLRTLLLCLFLFPGSTGLFYSLINVQFKREVPVFSLFSISGSLGLLFLSLVEGRRKGKALSFSTEREGKMTHHY